MIRKRILAATSVAAACAFGAQAFAMHQGQVPHISGGVGHADQQHMQQSARDYSLGLTFAAQTGQYLAGVDVSIRDAHGREVLSATSEGPMMLVDLPPGSYRVSARYEGQTRERAVQVPADGHRQLVMRWPFEDQPVAQRR